MVKESNFSFYYPPYYRIENKTKGIRLCYNPSTFQPLIDLEDQLWIHHTPQHNHELQMEVGDEVEFSIFRNLVEAMDEEEYLKCTNVSNTYVREWYSTHRNPQHYQVKKSGVNLIYEDNENDCPCNDKTVVQYASPRCRIVMVDKDDSTNQIIEDNEVVRHSHSKAAGDIEQDDHFQQSALFSIKEGSSSRAEKRKVIATDNNEWPPVPCRRRTGFVVEEVADRLIQTSPRLQQSLACLRCLPYHLILVSQVLRLQLPIPPLCSPQLACSHGS